MPSFARVLRVSLALTLSAALPAVAAEDPRDKAAVTAVLQSVLEKEKSGVEVPWSSSVTGNAGIIVVKRTYFPTPDRPCRDYTRTVVTPAGEKTTVNGTGCRMAAENWVLDEDAPATEKPKTAPAAGTPKKDSPPAKEAGGGAPEPTETATKAEAPKPAKKTAEKAAPPLLEYSLPTSSTI